MKLLYGFIVLITGCACAFASCRQLYRIIKLKLRGATCTATIVDFHEAVYRNHKAVFLCPRRVWAYPIVKFRNEKGKVIKTMTLNSIKNMREKKWNAVRYNYLGQEIDITYIDEYPWTYNYPQGVAKWNVLCMHNRWFKPFIGYIFVFVLSLLFFAFSLLILFL
jgi:hypothetical protein